MKIIRVDNFDGEGPGRDPNLIAENVSKANGDRIASLLNKAELDTSEDYYQVVEDDYVLTVWKSFYTTSIMDTEKIEKETFDGLFIAMNRRKAQDGFKELRNLTFNHQWCRFPTGEGSYSAWAVTLSAEMR